MGGANVLEINDLNFETEVLKSSVPPARLQRYLVRALQGALAHRRQAGRRAPGKVRVGKLDIDDSPGVASKFSIRGVPTVLIFKAGQESGRHVGVTNKETLVKLLGV